MSENRDFQNLLGRILASIAKALLVGLLKVLALGVYFLARALEIICGQIAEKLKHHVYD